MQLGFFKIAQSPSLGSEGAGHSDLGAGQDSPKDNDAEFVLYATGDPGVVEIA